MKLLLSCFPVDDGAGGAVILRHWITHLKSEGVHWIALGKQSGKVPYAAPHVTQSHLCPPSFGNVRLRLGRFWAWYKRVIWSAKIARAIGVEIRTKQPGLIWLMADFAMAPIALRLLPALQGRRMHVSIHDDLESTALREGCSAAFIREIRRFITGLRELDYTADAVSEELLADVAPTAERKAVVTLPVDPSKCAASFVPPRRDAPLLVGFSGNFLGEAEFRCFLDGLRVWSRISGLDWRLRCFGRVELGRLDSRIEARGFTPAEEVRSGLRDCDLLLLPSPLDRPEMRTNMPTKLVSYLELGRMIFTFAPNNSATRRVLAEAQMGPIMSVLDHHAVADVLSRLNDWNLDAAATGWHRLIESRFSEKRIHADLVSVLAT